MNTSNKTLLQILVEELPKNGGWPEGVEAMAQDADGAVQNYSDTRDIRINDEFAHGSSRIACSYSIESGECEVSTDRLTAIITREQYEAALAEKQNPLPWDEEKTDADGWIDWAGGECPVEEGTLVDVRYRCGRENHHVSAGIVCDMGGSDSDCCAEDWSHDNSTHDIIAYRLHQPQEANSRANDERLATDLVSVGLVQKPIDDACRVEADLNDCIGQPQEDIKAIRAEMLEVLDGTGLEVKLRTAMKLVDAFIDAGYRKQ